jgi:hypothetical protein
LSVEGLEFRVRAMVEVFGVRAWNAIISEDGARSFVSNLPRRTLFGFEFRNKNKDLN